MLRTIDLLKPEAIEIIREQLGLKGEFRIEVHVVTTGPRLWTKGPILFGDDPADVGRSQTWSSRWDLRAD